MPRSVRFSVSDFATMRADSRRTLGPALVTSSANSDSTGGSHVSAGAAGGGGGGGGAGSGGGGGAAFGLEGIEVVAKPRAGFDGGAFFFLAIAGDRVL